MTLIQRSLLTAMIFLSTFLETRAQAPAPSGKILVAYFSWGGNTREIAEQIHRQVGGDLFEIKTVKAYPTDYRPTTDVAKQEQVDNARPALATKVPNMADYDVVILGYPNWWGTLPMPLFTFLEAYDFSGKTILPFCTHEGSEQGRSVTDLKRLCPGATVQDGLAIRGSRARRAQLEVTDWLKEHSLVKEAK